MIIAKKEKASPYQANASAEPMHNTESKKISFCWFLFTPVKKNSSHTKSPRMPAFNPTSCR